MIIALGDTVKQNHFPDGTLNLRITDEMYDRLNYLRNSKSCATIHWRYENDSEIFTIQCLVDKIRELAPTTQIKLWMPYIPHARMDRAHVNDCLTLKTFCNIINSMRFMDVWVLNPHSDVSTALLNNCRVIPTKIFDTPLADIMRNENTIMMYPDAGAAKKFSTFIQQPYIIGLKNRDWNTGKILDYQLVIPDGKSIEGKDVVIMDDICSKGYTFLCAAQALKRAGARDIYLYIDHCENSILDGEMIKADLIKEIHTTDSLFTAKHEKIHVIPVD